MATVQFIDGRFAEHVRLTNVEAVGNEGSKRAIAHLNGKEYHVFNSLIDGFNSIWYEQKAVNPAPGVGTTIDGHYIHPEANEPDADQWRYEHQ